MAVATHPIVMGDDEHVHEHAHGSGPLAVAVLTVTSTRDADTDESGATAKRLVEAAGHDVEAYDVLPDDERAVRRRVREATADAVIVTGGTGLTPDDVTVEAVRPLYDREIPGFGEYFRRLSHEEVGTRAMLTRATAGVVDGTAVYLLPGNPDAVALGVDRAVLPEIEHVVALARRE